MAIGNLSDGSLEDTSQVLTTSSQLESFIVPLESAVVMLNRGSEKLRLESMN